jgi:hypothetical protein
MAHPPQVITRIDHCGAWAVVVTIEEFGEGHTEIVGYLMPATDVPTPHADSIEFLFVSPAITSTAHISARPPVVTATASGLWVNGRGAVTRIDPCGPYALVHTVEQMDCEGDGVLTPCKISHLIPAADLPSATALPFIPLAEQLRQRYGDTIGTRDLMAAAGIVTERTIYRAIQAHELHGTKGPQGWTFPIEEAAAFIEQPKRTGRPRGGKR